MGQGKKLPTDTTRPGSCLTLRLTTNLLSLSLRVNTSLTTRRQQSLLPLLPPSPPPNGILVGKQTRSEATIRLALVGLRAAPPVEGAKEKFNQLHACANTSANTIQKNSRAYSVKRWGTHVDLNLARLSSASCKAESPVLEFAVQISQRIWRRIIPFWSRKRSCTSLVSV